MSTVNAAYAGKSSCFKETGKSHSSKDRGPRCVSPYYALS
jgi:hypothetical protein